MKTKLLLFVTTLLLLYTFPVVSQVTVGSSNPPITGALLDLKEQSPNGQNITASRGLGLPRVRLTDASDITVDISGVTAANANEHIGLVVYATERFGINPVNCPGPYVWEGEIWKPLIPAPERKPEITMTDGDGNVYTARWFGYDPCDPSIGAYWTVSSLYSATKGTGGAFTNGQPRLNPAVSGTSNAFVSIPSTGIPAGTVSDYGLSSNLNTSANKNITGKSYQEFAEEYGLLYTYAQSMEACPPGWHLPSDTEWEALISGQGGYELCISKLRKADRWKWYYSASKVQDPGMKTLQWGKNDGDSQPVPSGFDVVPSGIVLENSGHTSNWGQLSYFWSSGQKFYDVVYEYTDMLSGIPSSQVRYISVRCVKD